MRVLIINTFDIRGGAARAAYRLHRGLNRIGVDSYMLVKRKESTDQKVLEIKPSSEQNTERQSAVFDRIKKDYVKKNMADSSLGLFSTGYPGSDLANLEIIAEADIINLHWVAELMSVESVSSLLKLGKPVFWTLHDMNPFTGGCHYTAGCSLFKTNCSPCRQLVRDPYRLTYFNLKNKINLIREKGVTVVTPSEWMAKEARESIVFSRSQVVTVPNSIDIDIFSPQSKQKAKEKFGIDKNTLTILTGVSKWVPRRKGFGEFLSAMELCLKNPDVKKLVEQKRLQILCFGNPADEIKELNISYKALGKIRDDSMLNDAYNAADIFVLPSIEDNLPNTMVEAMACGTPVIGFDVGGMPDMIKDGVTGKLVPFRNIELFAQAIIDLLFNPTHRREMWGHTRQLIEKRYKLEDQGLAYKELFQSFLPTGDSIPQIRFLPVNEDLKPLYEHYAAELTQLK